MCAKLGELFELPKRKALTANIFLGGEAFSNLLLKEFLHGVGCRNSIKHRCVALLYFLQVYSAIIERKQKRFVMNS